MNKYCCYLMAEYRWMAWFLSGATLLCLPVFGQVPTAGSLGITVKNEGAGSHTQWLAPAANEVIGFDASGQLVSKTSGGAWGGITGTLSAQVDLQSVLNAKAPLVSPTFTGTVTIPSGASIAGYLTTAAAAGAYQPLSETLTNLTGVTVDPFGASLLELIGAEGLRSAAELGTLATQNGVISDYTLGATSSTDNALVRFDGATGKVVQNSNVTIDDSGNIQMSNDTTLFRIGNGPFLAESTSPAGPSARWNGPYFEVVRYNGGNSAGIAAANIDIGAERDAVLIRTGASAVKLTNGTSGYASLNVGNLQLSGGPIVRAGSGPPEGSVTAPVGSVYTRTDGGTGTTLYTKESGSGNTGWSAALSGVVPVASGGTGASTVSDARSALGLTIGTDVLAPNGSGASLTSLNASALASGIVGSARLGTGTASSSTYLRGDGTWATPGGSGDVVGPGSSENNAIAVYDGASGKLLKDSGVTIAGGVLAAWSGVLSTGYGAESGSNAAYYNASGIVYSISGQGFQLSPHLSTESWTLTFPENNGENGQVLVTDGSGNTSWSTIGGAGTVSSVSVSGSDGIEVDSGSPVTTSGTIALGINASTLASHLGLASTYQPLDAQLTDISALAPTKGKLIVGDGSNWVDLGVGSDDQVLTADDAESTGVKWATLSAGSGSTSVDVQTFTTSGTWTKPAGAVSVKIIMVGGGGGGGSGRRGATSTATGGGGGGTGSGMLMTELDASLLGTTESVIVGMAGSGGAAVTANDTSGANGTDGGNSTFYIFQATGGGGGTGGSTSATAAAGTGGNNAIGGPIEFTQSKATGGAGSSTGAGAFGTSVSYVWKPTGGGGGGGVSSSDVSYRGGNGGVLQAGVYSTIAGGGYGNTAGEGGTNGIQAPFWVGTGGGGGAAGDTAGTTAGGRGGTGANYGSGGGGGGASRNGADSGAGGNGAPGYVRVETLIQN